jgi:regulator of sigma D
LIPKLEEPVKNIIFCRLKCPIEKLKSKKKKFIDLSTKKLEHSIKELKDYLSGAGPIFRIAVWTDPNSFQSQSTSWKSANTNLQSNKTQTYYLQE